MALKIAFCAGHGGYASLNPKVYATPGKRTPDGEPEWIFNNKVALAFEEAMKQYEGVELLRVDDRTGKTDVPLATRTNKAKSWKADIYISFHHNANTSKWGTWGGTETFTQIGSRPQSEKLAGLVHNQQLTAYGLQNRGLKKADFHITREMNNAGITAILIEGGFMDSTIDIVKLRNDNVLKAAGYGAAIGIAQFASLKKKASAPQKPIIKEEDQMLEKAILIGGFPDFAVAEILAARLKAPVFTRAAYPGGQVAKELYVVGGSLDGLKADKIINLSGVDRFAVAAAVKKFLG